MPRIESSLRVPVDVATAFAVSQTHGAQRIAWDPFIKRQELVGGDRPARGVRTRTVSRHGLKMLSEYVSFRPPSQVGMKMIEGPWFFDNFAAGWSFAPLDPDDPTAGTQATWRYTFTTKPTWLSPIADRIGGRLLQRDIDARLAAYADACSDPAILAAIDRET